MLHLCVGVFLLLQSTNIDCQFTNVTCQTQPSCSDTPIEFYCQVSGMYLHWSVISMDLDLYLDFIFTSLDIGRNITVSQKQFHAALIDAQSTSYLSKLTFTSDISLNNTKVACASHYDENFPKTCNFLLYAPPDSPNTISVQFLSKHTSVLQWKPPFSELTITKYELDVNPIPMGGSCSNGTCSTVDTTINVTHLLYNCIEYTFSVTAFNCAGASPPFKVNRGYINQYIPKPENLVVNIINVTSVEVSWSIEDNCYLQYTVYYGSSDSHYSARVHDTSIIITNLVKGRTYNFSVASTFGNRISNWSEPVITSLNVPLKVTNLTVLPTVFDCSSQNDTQLHFNVTWIPMDPPHSPSVSHFKILCNLNYCPIFTRSTIIKLVYNCSNRLDHIIITVTSFNKVGESLPISEIIKVQNRNSNDNSGLSTVALSSTAVTACLVIIIIIIIITVIITIRYLCVKKRPTKNNVELQHFFTQN